MAAPCAWTVDWSCCPGGAPLDAALKLNAEGWATYVLWALTGRRFGACPVTVRPCYRKFDWRSYDTYGVWLESPTGSGNTWFPYIGAVGEWRNCGCFGICCCGASCEVWLPGPVISISQVTVAGVVLAPSAYRVDDADVLVRQDGGCWPECASLDVPASDPAAFVVQYSRGEPLPASAGLAAGALACEFVKACQGAACGLPANVQSITREGVSFQLVDPTQEFQGGLTGVKMADDFITAVNPHHLAERPSVSSIDLVPPRQQTWP